MPFTELLIGKLLSEVGGGADTLTTRPVWIGAVGLRGWSIPLWSGELRFLSPGNVFRRNAATCGRSNNTHGALC